MNKIKKNCDLQKGHVNKMLQNINFSNKYNDINQSANLLMEDPTIY